MCGIVGVLQYKSEVDREVRARALKIIFSEAMLKTEPRGDDATGLYQVQSNGDWMLAKKGEKVTKWLVAEPGGDDPVVYQDFVETWDQHPFEMATLVGHCRKATIGSRGKDNNDNHPFAVQIDEKDAILGIHNGTLNNHETIFKRLKELSDSHLVRQGSVDSEAIFHMMYHLTENGTKPVDGDVLQYMGKRIDGAYACIAVNSRFPEQAVTFRNGRPTEFAMVAPLNMVLIASDKKFLESAIEKYNFIRQWMGLGLPKLDVDYRMLVEKNFRIFDLSKTFPKNPTWNSLDNISETGTMVTHSSSIEEGWRPASTTSHSHTNAAGHARHTATASKKVTTAPGTTSASQTVLPTGAKKGSDDDLVTVNAEVKKTKLEVGSEEEAKFAYEKAKLLGLCPVYDKVQEVSRMLGLTEAEVHALPIIELATKLGQAHFNYGYALGRVDSKQVVEDIRKKAREQLKTMERTAEKQRRAQLHIWEMKQLILFFQALNDGGYGIHLKNVQIVVNNYTKFPKERKADILAIARDIFNDTSADKQVKDLVAELVRNKKRIAAEGTK